MKKIFVSGLLGIAVLLASCGTVSVEDRMASYLADTICMADEAYKLIESTKAQVSELSLQDMIKKTDEISKKIDTLKSTSFGSEQQLKEAQDKIMDKKALAERAIAEAKAKCQPSETSIEQATRDYQ